MVFTDKKHNCFCEANTHVNKNKKTRKCGMGSKLKYFYKKVNSKQKKSKQ